MSNSSIRPISGATTPGQSEPVSDDHEGVLCIPQSSIITGASPSDCLVSYPGYSLGVGVVLPLCRDAVDVFCSLSQLGHQDTHLERVLPLCRDAVGVFCSLSQLGHQDIHLERVLPLCRDAVGVFYSLSQLGQHTAVWFQ